MSDVLRSFEMLERYVVCRDKPAADGSTALFAFDSEPEMELALSTLGYERDGGEDAFGFRRWKRI